MNIAFVVAVGLVACGAPHHVPAPVPTVDPARHTVRSVNVAPGVQLEVLDFGGAGQPIVLLAGLGNTAHIFDELGPALTTRGHVVAITRRGYGSSSGPADGYDIATRSADDIAVLDALGLRRVVLVGHSIAGDELTELAALIPERVAALVYIDAAHDHSVNVFATAPPTDMSAPPPTAMASWRSFATWYTRQIGFDIPTGEYLASLDIAPDGSVRGMRDSPYVAKYLELAPAQDFTRVHAPALVLIAMPTGPEAVIPGYIDFAPDRRAALAAWWPDAVAYSDASRARVKADLAGAHVLEYPASRHYLFITERSRVLVDIDAFLRTL